MKFLQTLLMLIMPAAIGTVAGWSSQRRCSSSPIAWPTMVVFSASPGCIDRGDSDAFVLLPFQIAASSISALAEDGERAPCWLPVCSADLCRGWF